MNEDGMPPILRKRLEEVLQRELKTTYLCGTKGPVKVTPGQEKILQAMMAGHLRPSEVAKELGLSASAVSMQLGRLSHAIGARSWFDVFLRWQAIQIAKQAFPEPQLK